MTQMVLESLNALFNMEMLNDKQFNGKEIIVFFDNGAKARITTLRVLDSQKENTDDDFATKFDFKKNKKIKIKDVTELKDYVYSSAKDLFVGTVENDIVSLSKTNIKIKIVVEEI